MYPAVWKRKARLESPNHGHPSSNLGPSVVASRSIIQLEGLLFLWFRVASRMGIKATAAVEQQKWSWFFTAWVRTVQPKRWGYDQRKQWILQQAMKIRTLLTKSVRHPWQTPRQKDILDFRESAHCKTTPRWLDTPISHRQNQDPMSHHVSMISTLWLV